ncbi:MAG: hypothetical protein J6U40_05255, partial [Kiritimatiellae bacterium]|nr:hypothetical protein [Kiritimatiellia bacterium]
MKKNVWVLGGAFLLVNALGWWWAGSARRSVENGGEAAATNAVTVAEEVAKSEWKVFRPNLVSVKQVSLTSDRLLTLRFTFSRPVDW